MIDDLKIIRRKYGEKMYHFCREEFSTLLEQPGLLSKLLLDNFHESHNLYDDLFEDNKLLEFKNYLYSLVDVENDNQVIDKNPEELMSLAGYNLFECYTEEDIQSYKKYYASGEELCTFRGGRLNTDRVFFAVKKNVDEIKRENFQYPTRQDEYGTSVISIQFSKDSTNTLSIKNRYNHRVNNPDSTFSNNLDNIVPGLTDSFAKYKGLVQSHINNGFEINNYVRANDGKYYKYNYEMNNIYYCPDNIIIDNFEVHKYDKSRYLIIDYFIIDLSSKTIALYDSNNSDSFPDAISQIKSIEIENIDNGKRLVISGDDDKKVEILLDKDNNMISINLGNIVRIGDDFLSHNYKIEECIAPQLEEMGNRCFYGNKSMKTFEAPNLVKMGNRCFWYNAQVQELKLPQLEEMGDDCFCDNEVMRIFEAPNLKKMGIWCFRYNKEIQELYLPQLEEMGDDCFYANIAMKIFEAPNLVKMGNRCFYWNDVMKIFEAPNLVEMGEVCFCFNKETKNYLYSQVEKNNQRNGRGGR